MFRNSRTIQDDVRGVAVEDESTSSLYIISGPFPVGILLLPVVIEVVVEDSDNGDDDDDDDTGCQC